ncbi:MAG: hypothetical protein IH941_05200 [Acidobacteria bacterium]|nr:hypothetical protein [Acidobacteriota bacterium]
MAAFAAARNDGRKWIDVMEQWNREQPDHQYKRLGNFIRDAHAAYRKLMGADLQWAGRLRRQASRASSSERN